jgi:hypothetical protein
MKNPAVRPGIPFTLYLMPFGEKVPQWINRPADVEDKARAVIAAGGRFEVEMLQTGEASFEVVREKDGETESVAAEFCANGPDVPAAVDKLVADAHARIVQP